MEYLPNCGTTKRSRKGRLSQMEQLLFVRRLYECHLPAYRGWMKAAVRCEFVFGSGPFTDADALKCGARSHASRAFEVTRPEEVCHPLFRSMANVSVLAT